MIDPWAVAVIGFIACGVVGGLTLATGLAFAGAFRPAPLPPPPVAPKSELR